MPLATALSSDVLTNAGVAYIHYLSFMLCFGALALERRLLKSDPNRGEATAMVITDVVYGIAALALLVSGILRVLYFGQGGGFYTQNPLFWWKVGVFLSVGALSLYPTITYILWAVRLRKGELPDVSEELVRRLGWVINVELVGFASIPLMATLMARGVGLPAA
ncbi:MAG: DUF2214 family protein [Prochlorococcus sp.]|nr:DUF2214 family protein [Prochlorococcaceae cyanobacterium Fu_MAG_50]